MNKKERIQADVAAMKFLHLVRILYREMRYSLSVEQFEFAKSKAEENLSVESSWMNTIAPGEAWREVVRGPGFGPHDSGGDGIPFPACHACGGIKPSKGARSNFIEEAIGHKKDCPYVE